MKSAEQFYADMDAEFVALLTKGTPLHEMKAVSIQRLKEFQADTLDSACEAANEFLTGMLGKEVLRAIRQLKPELIDLNETTPEPWDEESERIERAKRRAEASAEHHAEELKARE